MTARTLPADCPCPWVRHPDGAPWIYRPDPTCRHHSRPRRDQNATVTPIRKPGRLIRPAISLGIERVRTPNQPRHNPRREVRPVGRALPDLDAKGSFHCPCAEVIAVIAKHPVPLPEHARGLLPAAQRRPR